jgi:hypothetical protein
MFNLRLPVKTVDFHVDVTSISVFDGIRDIFEAQFIMQLPFVTVQIYIYYCSKVIFTNQM